MALKTPAASDIRRQFIEFFVDECAHREWPSSSVVPYNDPTLLFINAGMNQFKPIFLGDVAAGSPFVGLKRAVDTQKCIRAGGKHNDLEDVGKDVYHHTFFEMLGNWSFGDYFKKEAIHWAWQLLTEVWKMDPSRLYVTYYGGDPKQPEVPADEEARSLWLSYLPATRVLPFGAKDNFWEMGEVGPCGPCSEIHYDRIGGRDASSLVNADDPDVLEIWNLVFMQFNREGSGNLTPLPAACVDTGMGLERVVSILQNKRSNYDTDLFVPLFEAIRSAMKTPTLPPYGGKVGEDDADRIDMAYRVVADHVRTLTIAISDGAAPSSEGRGYVIRRILRRAVRYGRQILGAPKDEPWLAGLIPVAAQLLGGAFPETLQCCRAVQAVVEVEELQFSRTLDKGVALFTRLAQKIIASAASNKQTDKRTEKQTGYGRISGEDAFNLYATYGFPLDLTQLMAEEVGLEVDCEGFVKAMETHKKVSENATFHAGVALALKPDSVAELQKNMRVPPTDDAARYDWSSLKAEGPPVETVLRAIWNGKAFLGSIDSTTSEPVALIFDSTNFYAEGGGQLADIGTIEGDDDGSFRFAVSDVRKLGGYVLHCGVVVTGTLAVSTKARLMPDFVRRADTAKNHTGTHVLNFALRKVLGGQVEQRGSLVEPSRLRFDFSCQSALTVDQVRQIEEVVQSVIAAGHAVDAKEAPLQAAKSVDGLQACFGEVYPDPVRVVSVGARVDDLLRGAASGRDFPVEFCGGTHLATSEEIGAFIVISEEAVARGVRRIIGITGDTAERAQVFQNALMKRAAALSSLEKDAVDAEVATLRSILKNKRDELGLLCRKRVADLIDATAAARLDEAKVRVKALKKLGETEGAECGRQIMGNASSTAAAVYDLPQLEGDFKAMEAFEGAFHQVAPDVACCLVSRSLQTLSVLGTVPKTCRRPVNAGEWVQAAMKPVNGKGGGRAAAARGVVLLSGDADASATTVLRAAQAYADASAASSAP